MNVLVIYQSRSGHTRQAADSIAQAARNLNHTVTVKAVIELQKADVDAADRVFIGTWVHGLILFAVHPADLSVLDASLPSLEGKKVGTFCTYAFHPKGSLREMGTMLKHKGAVIAAERAFHRRRPGHGAEDFVKSVLN